MPIDPVCRVQVDTKIKASYKGVGYFFCSENCKAKFLEDPEVFTE